MVTFLLILEFPVALTLAWVYDLSPDGIRCTSAVDESAQPNVAGSLKPTEVPKTFEPELASVAVIPFTNPTPTSEFAFLSDALALELQSSLSRLHEIRVASRYTSPELDGRMRDIRDIARELDVQQRTAEVIASAFGGERLRSEIRRAEKSVPSSLDAWGLVKRSRRYLLSYSPAAVAQAMDLLRQAVELDPDYAIARASLGLVIAEKIINGISDDPAADLAEATELVELAERLAPQDPVVLRTAGCVWAYSGDCERSESLLRRAISIAPMDIGTWGYLGWPLVAKGTPEGLSELKQILGRLLDAAPRHPGHAYWLLRQSVALSCERNYAAALTHAEIVTRKQPRFALSRMNTANIQGSLKRSNAARASAKQCGEISQKLTPGHYTALMARFSDVPGVIHARTSGLRSVGWLAAD